MAKKAKVKNPLRPHDVVEEEEEDLGIPGKLYFEKPKVFTVEAFHQSKLPEFDTGGARGGHQPPGPEEYYRTEGPVRLRSSHHLPRYTPPEKHHYLLTRRPPQIDADEYIRMMKVEGFGEGAVVARRFADHWRARWHANWGTITRVTQNVPWDAKEAWSPYVVKWWDVSNFNGVADTEPAWAEDLLVIHAALDKDVLESILEHQQE